MLPRPDPQPAGPMHSDPAAAASVSLPVDIAPRHDPRIPAAVENWKGKLLDLSKRNRAMNFRPTKVSTVTIVDEQPAEVFRQMAVRGQPMRFHAAPDPEPDAEDANSGDAPAAAGTPDPFGEGEDDAALGLDFAPYEATSLDDRHTDQWLQTTAPADALDHSLRRLEEQARTSLEEQGVNTLFLALGMLHYTEDRADQVFRAPLVLLPAALTRKTARTGYELRATDDDPIVNPALAEYLRGRGITLGDLPDSAALTDDYDLQTLFSAVAAQVAGNERWAVKTDIYLSLFSFQKFVMYKDLEANAEAVAAHRLIRQLVTRTGGGVIGLPPEIRGMDLDEEYPPESTFQVVDADASQLRAIAACARGHDLVIEGPPGTGKSQTITNLIAAALAADRSVLFVAEKMAALEVVHDRLVQAGLGEFCLELHSTKANKRAVMQELGAALDASFQSLAIPQASTERLPQVRHTLTEYARAVHTPFGTLGLTPFLAYGALGRVLDAPRVRLEGRIDGVGREQLDDALRSLRDLAATGAEVGVPAEHPWHDTGRTFYSADDLDDVRDAADDLARRAGALAAHAAAVVSALGLPPVRGLVDVDTAAEVAEVLARSPGAPLDVLGDEAWNAPPTEATGLVEQGRRIETLKARIKTRFRPEVLEQDHAADIAYVEKKAEGALAFLAWLDGRWRSIRRRWMRYRLPAFSGALVDQAAEMKHVDRLRAERASLQAAAGRGQALFGALWDGERSRWDALDGYIRWVVEFRAACVRHGLDARAAEVASKAGPDVSEVAALRAEAGETRAALDRLREAVAWPEGYLSDAPLDEIGGRAAALASNVALAPRWAAFEGARQAVASGIAREVLPAVMDGELPVAQAVPAFERAFYMKWTSAVVQEREPLARFGTLTHEERLAEFRRMDERVLRENQAALIAQLRDRVQHRLQQPGARDELPYLRGQMVRQRGLAPLRRTLQHAQSAIRAIKPCFLMSPLSVAQFLDGGAPGFDLVIFDEASQLPSEDAVGAIVRGRHLVVVGDPKQLPPTNFFAISTGQVNAQLGEDGLPLVDDAESILEQFMGAGVPMSRLKWHYRSAHESLINFSNVAFYDSDLFTFPSVETAGTTGLQFEHVADGVYEGKGVNTVEAQRVADAVVRFAKEQADRRARGEETLTLGVGTFNMRQQLAIQDELERRRRLDSSIEPFFDRGLAEPFFVKNLENIQGDERDVIFISVTYARAANGQLRYNFGPLNGQNGWRRLNVLVTRARRQMRVFASMRGDDISPTATSSDGPRLLRDFLLYAERGRLDGAAVDPSPDAESPFEKDVARELTARGVAVVPQVGVAGYRIDLGVLDDAAPGRFLCGIECDGVAYHASETARDRDRLRQQVLETRGWRIHRVWSTDWFKDRAGQVDRLLKLIGEDRVHAREEAAAERSAREEAAARARAEAEERAREQAELIATGPSAPYARPTAPPYPLTPGDDTLSGTDLLATPMGQLADAVRTVVNTESPVHRADLVSRIVGMWGTRAGQRIQARIEQACTAAEGAGMIRRRGDFLWAADADGQCEPRSRAGMRIPADRIPPEEFRAAVLSILAQGHAFSREQMTTEVRTLLGYGRTSAALEEGTSDAIAALLRDGRIGEASTGLRLRN